MDFHHEKAIYLQIADFIVEQVLSKKWGANDKIPSVREMAIQLQVNPNTVARTYLFLEEKNIIQLQRGIGYFISASAREKAMLFKKNEFLTAVLPRIFRTMDLLEMSLFDFKTLYNNRKNAHEKK